MAEFAGNERYEVLGRLGQGGMGTVYTAFDRRRQRRVALKVLRDPERGSLFRFKREFRAIADLRHPHLVRLFDLGLLPEGAGFFFTMELVEGQELRTWVRARVPATSVTAATVREAATATWNDHGPERGPEPVGSVDAPELARVLAGVVEGLAYLHAARKVHRDLKPSNVIVDEQGRAKILDFGILRELDQETGLTAQAALGTPLYMAPEQVSGEEVGPPADLYALGCMLYELIAGAPPFSGSAQRVLMRHVREVPQPPSKVRPCDPALEALCLDLLKKEPAERPSSDRVLDRLWEVAGTSSARAPRAAPAVPLGVVGRDDELARLERACADPRPDPRVVLVAGESGAGRSALLTELAERRLAAGATVWLGHCYEREQLPYKAFDEVMDAAAVELVRRGDAAKALLPPGTPSLVRLFPVLRECPAIGDLPPETTLRDPQAERERALRAMVQLLGNLSSGPPLVVVDDLERADPESIDVLAWLARQGGLPCVVVGAVRDGDAGPSSTNGVPPASGARRGAAGGGISGAHESSVRGEVPSDARDSGTHNVRARLARLEAEPRVEVVRLGPLPPAVLGDVVRARATVSLSDSQRVALVEHARGNPYLAVELACAVNEGDGEAVPTPAELVARRLQRLGKDSARVLEVAAAAGGPSTFALLALVTGLHPATLADAVDELVHGHLLREVPSARGEEAWAVAHERLRVAAYERLGPERRREVHRTLAEQLAFEEDCPRAVAHWHAAGEPARARTAALSAAEKAEAKLAFGQAAELYRLAAAATEGGASGAVQEARARALSKGGRHADAAGAYEQAAALAPAAEQGRELTLHATVERLAAGEYAAGLAGLDRLLAPFGETTRLGKLASLLSVTWRVVWLCTAWMVEDLLALLGRCGRARPLDAETAFRLRLYDAAHHHLALPRPLIAEVFGGKHAMLARRHGDPQHLGRARIAHGLMLAGGLGPLAFGRALHHVNIGEALCHEAGDTRGLLHGYMCRGFIYLLDSNWEGVRSVAEKSDELARRAGLFGEPVLVNLHLMRIGCELWCGDLPALVRHAERDQEQARARGNVAELAWPLAFGGYVLLWQGQVERGKAALAEALRVTPQEPYTAVRLTVELLALSIDLQAGDARAGLEKFEEIRRRRRASRLVTTSMEGATYRVMRARLNLLARRQGLDPGCPIGEAVALGLLPAPSSLRDEALRLKAAAAFQKGKLSHALALVQRSARLADRRNNRFSLALALAARATLRARLGLPGAGLDRERAADALRAIGASRCYLLAVEGWDDPG